MNDRHEEKAPRQNSAYGLLGPSSSPAVSPARDRRWLAPPVVPDEVVYRIAAAAGIPLALARLLAARGVTEPGRVTRFLDPKLADLSPHDGLPGLEEAAARTASAVRRGERILVHGDYDVDGMSATALLVRFLRGAGAEVCSHIPHRLRDGYGLSETGVQECRGRECTLLITADCGSHSLKEITALREHGIDCVVTDHHELGRALPPAVAVVNPKREGSDGRHVNLAGVGVALRLVQAAADALGRGSGSWEQDLDLVALGTVADIVPLEGDNRVLARTGLQQLGETAKPGLRALMDLAGVRRGRMGAWDISFGLAPRLNAAGRLGMAQRGLDLLLTDDAAEGHELAQTLDCENQSRQKIDQAILKEALEKVDLEVDLADTWALVLASPKWHRGVVGIVASRLVEKYGRPAVLLAIEDGRAFGSGRSIEGFDLARALDEAGSLLLTHGGHAMAVGLSLRDEDLPAFRARLNEIARRSITAEHLMRRLRLDAELPLGDLTPDFVRMLRELEPHGLGNPKPLFVARGVQLASTPIVMKGAHLRFRVRQGDAEGEAVAFNLAGRLRELEGAGRRLDLAFEASLDEFRGTARAELRVRDFLPAGDARGGACA